jgi:hypothetical protein
MKFLEVEKNVIKISQTLRVWSANQRFANFDFDTANLSDLHALHFSNPKSKPAKIYRNL